MAVKAELDAADKMSTAFDSTYVEYRIHNTLHGRCRSRGVKLASVCIFLWPKFAASQKASQPSYHLSYS